MNYRLVLLGVTAAVFVLELATVPLHGWLYGYAAANSPLCGWLAASWFADPDAGNPDVYGPGGSGRGHRRR